MAENTDDFLARPDHYLLKTWQAARVLGISQVQLRSRIHRKKIKAVQIDGHFYISVGALRAHMKGKA